jgi:hypothetical protein
MEIAASCCTRSPTRNLNPLMKRTNHAESVGALVATKRILLDRQTIAPSTPVAVAPNVFVCTVRAARTDEYLSRSSWRPGFWDRISTPTAAKMPELYCLLNGPIGSNICSPRMSPMSTCSLKPQTSPATVLGRLLQKASRFSRRMYANRSLWSGFSGWGGTPWSLWNEQISHSKGQNNGSPILPCIKSSASVGAINRFPSLSLGRKTEKSGPARGL